VPEQRDLHDPSTKSSLIIFGATGLFLFLFFFQAYRVGIPAAVDWLVENLPAEIFEAVGEQSINTLSSSEWQPSALDSGRQQHLRTLLMQNSNGSLKPPSTTLYFRHADYAKESSNLAVSKIRNQGAKAMLAQANTDQELTLKLIDDWLWF